MSLMPRGRSISMKASTFSRLPEASMSMRVCEMSTTFARKTETKLKTSCRAAPGAHARGPLALLDDLLDRAVVARRHYRDARPLRVERAPDRQRLDVEPARAEQPHDARQLARLVGDDDGERVTHKDGCWVLGVGF